MFPSLAEDLKETVAASKPTSQISVSESWWAHRPPDRHSAADGEAGARRAGLAPGCTARWAVKESGISAQQQDALHC